MTTERIIVIMALAFIAGAVIWLYRKGRKEAEMIFESDYYNLDYFVHHCTVNQENEIKIMNQLYHLSTLKGADKEKLQVLNTEFWRIFTVSPSDIVADHESENY